MREVRNTQGREVRDTSTERIYAASLPTSVPTGAPTGAPTDAPTSEMLPPPNATYASYEDCITDINQWAARYGYACVQKSSKRKDGVYIRVWIRCDKGGAPRPLTTGARQGRSRRTNCPFELRLNWNQATLQYDLETLDAAHNHAPSGDISAHVAYRYSIRTTTD